MTRWAINVGDPVLISQNGEKYEGYVLTKFVFEGEMHYVVQTGATFMVSNVVQPNKKQELAIPSRKGVS